MRGEPEKEETQIHLDVPPRYKEEERLDVYITRFVKNASRNKVQQGIKEGRVVVNGKTITRVSYRVQGNDTIVCTVWRPPPLELIPEDLPLDIVFEDEWLLVVNKAAGMVVHPAYGHRSGTLVNALLHHLGGKSISLEEDEGLGDLPLSSMNARSTNVQDTSIRPGIVHRLDKDTSGLLVVAKDNVTHARLAKQFMAHTTRRKYRAIVWGTPKTTTGRIESALGRDPRDRKKMAVVPAERGKHAITNYHVLEPLRHTALVEFRLETGRTHQIRVHANHINHPILGDATYGGQVVRYGLRSGPRDVFFRRLFERMPRQALHAFQLGFLHPQTGQTIDFECPMPEDMAFVWASLRRVEGG